jgi:sigma-E factor negative regulatory protein RseC
MMERATGYKAVAISYLGPLVLIIVSLIILDSMSVKEAVAGLISVSLLLPYFVVLYLFRKSINRSFIFKLKT